MREIKEQLYALETTLLKEEVRKSAERLNELIVMTLLNMQALGKFMTKETY